MISINPEESAVPSFSPHRSIDSVPKISKQHLDLMLSMSLNVKVKYVPGERKAIADHLSRNKIDLAREKTLITENLKPDVTPTAVRWVENKS